MTLGFNIGQEVACIDASTDGGIISKLKEGEVYQVKDITSLCKCHGISIDVGHTIDIKFTGYVYCKKCNTRFHVGNTLWYSSKRFTPLENIAEGLINELTQPLVKSLPAIAEQFPATLFTF